MKKNIVDTYTIEVRVSLSKDKEPEFTYYEQGNPEPLDNKQRVIQVTGPTIIFYKLIDLNLSPAGLRFIGAGFKTPFDGVIENAFVSENGDTLILEDLCLDNGTTGFHLLFKTNDNNLIIMSPDPEIINKGKV